MTATLVTSRRSRHVVVGLVAGGVVLLVIGPMFLVILSVGGLEAATSPSSYATAAIPADALDAYIDAAEMWDIDWAILAAIGSVECDHGRYQADGCNPPGTMNHAGARGYMQFIGSTWRTGLGQYEMEPRTSPPAPDGQGFATDGNNDGTADPWNWADATHSAARYLTHLGVTTNPERALYGYNHSHTYVTEVLRLADQYRNASNTTTIEHTPDRPVGPDEIVTIRGIRVHQSLAPNLEALLEDASAAGFTTLAGGGYRSADSQIATRRANCGSSHYAIYDMPSNACSPPTARPGRSMHERGLAIDFTINGSIIHSRNTPIFTWLAANAARYGLYNLPSEPWHWSINGR